MLKKTTLENGIRIITERMESVRSIAFGILVNAGPRDEAAEQCGIAHLAEHMLFQGTSSRSASQIAKLMGAAGDTMGAFTTRDYTCYYATVLDDYFPYALDLLGDIFLNSIFPTDSLVSEKDAILNEIRAERDSPEHRVHSLLKATVWPDHNLGSSITGPPEVVKRLTREDLIYFTHEHYRADNLIISAAGHLDHDDVVAQVRDGFWRLSGEGVCTPVREAKFNSEVRVEYSPVSQAYFSIGLPAYPYVHENRYTLHLLNNILGGGMSSRFYRHIREEKGLVYHIGSQYHAYLEGGLLIIEGSTLPEYLMRVLSTVLLELYLLATREKPLNEDELWRAKMHIRGQHLISSEDTNTRMSRLATQELYFGRQISPDEILKEIEGVGLGLIQETAEELLDNFVKNITVAVVGPESPGQYSEEAIKEMLAGLA
ncbi:MAG: insulinase family protein [Desulfobulbaceae bacterium]|nr:insulinase family protein [Desulfobulbaceae bacterium]